MSYSDFYKDITDWEWIYSSGRLHKPVIALNKTTGDRNIELAKALQYNLESALLCSLLLLNKSEVTEWELFLQITGLSYMGTAAAIVICLTFSCRRLSNDHWRR